MWHCGEKISFENCHALHAIVAKPAFRDGIIPNFWYKTHWLSQKYMRLQQQQGNCNYSETETTSLITLITSL
jgi:hypothetical protein